MFSFLFYLAYWNCTEKMMQKKLVNEDHDSVATWSYKTGDFMGF